MYKHSVQHNQVKKIARIHNKIGSVLFFSSFQILYDTYLIPFPSNSTHTLFVDVYFWYSTVISHHHHHYALDCTHHQQLLLMVGDSQQ